MGKKYEIVITEDGSNTLKELGSNISFHSLKGAIQESSHIFIKNGFEYFSLKYPEKKKINVFEMGFGTGLNALLTAKAARANAKPVVYEAVDLYPITGDVFNKLNYAQLLNETELYRTIMQTAWEQFLFIDPFLRLKKTKCDIREYVFTNQYDIVYFDAFAPDDQPEIWKKSVFEKIFNALNPNGIMLTYCSKSIVRQTLSSVGFVVEKLPGPPGKREIIRAVKC